MQLSEWFEKYPMEIGDGGSTRLLRTFLKRGWTYRDKHDALPPLKRRLSVLPLNVRFATIPHHRQYLNKSDHSRQTFPPSTACLYLLLYSFTRQNLWLFAHWSLLYG
ncbi:hypothetical protein GCM10011362_27200 [Marinobacter halophilus]|nr:hypothetical protein GCM10011362_27200 [Marinobacter halophilus]